jgi:hypothetical protein
MVLVESFDAVDAAEVVTVTVAGALVLILLVAEADELVLVVVGMAGALSATAQLISAAINWDSYIELKRP